MKKYNDWMLGVLCSVLLMSPVFAQTEGLEAALRATLSLHPALNSKRAEVAAKGFMGESIRAQRLPSLSAQVAAHDNGTQPATLRARQPLWTFGRIDSAIAYAEVDLTLEEADLIRVKRQLLDQTAVAYARVLGIKQRLDVAEANVTEMDKLYQQIQRRQQGLLASVADVRLALARLVQARAQKERFDGELAVAKTELHALTQKPVSTELPVSKDLTHLPPIAEVQALAQARSADVALKTQRVALALADITREKTAPMPTVYLQADRYLSQPGYGNEMRLGVVLEANLDSMGFAATGRSKAANARLQANEEDLKATRNEISRSVDSLYANRQLQQSLINNQVLSVGELSEILTSYQRQYQSGYKAWQDVLNMQRELSEQRLQQVQAENDWLVYTLKLVALTGGLDALAIDTRE